MGASYLSISAGCTLLSIGLLHWAEISPYNIISDGIIFNDHHLLELLQGSATTVVLYANLLLNTFILFTLCLKTFFFGELYASEVRKLVERLSDFLYYKASFLLFVIKPTKLQAGIWLSWLIVLCSLKICQGLASDRLERLNTSPFASPLTYFRVYSVLLLVISVDFLWIGLCLVVYRMLGSSFLVLLFFEPLGTAFGIMQGILVYGFQLLEIWMDHSAGDTVNCPLVKHLYMSTAGSLCEWKNMLIRNLGFYLEIMISLMSIAHYVHIWLLQGMAFHLLDAFLFSNIQALIVVVIKRVHGFIRLTYALRSLHALLPDATSDELRAYDDDCAICREPMTKAKTLSCNHLFHLICLRSWLDQSLSENYSCPTCRKPFSLRRTEVEENSSAVDVSINEQSSHHTSTGLHQQNPHNQVLSTSMLPNQAQNSFEHVPWRGSEADYALFRSLSGQGLDGAGPSSRSSVRLGRIQTMMRHLEAVGETYSHAALDTGPWNLWPLYASQVSASGSSVPPVGSLRFPGNTASLHAMTSRANILAMVETVREVLPHVRDDLILEDLLRTNSAERTANNLLRL
ncbi:E3 ubiquitin protein ligase RIN2-like [Impatiens glandulifera]|uniref:E3 ubiquitin protein ligase RIN2-like n=1 Tax=Impatiens glandulifera TaxID=253017 RepID=UPI001FB14596|nr:E3 ubiquitin protein ligase RIN2-like [Impatiens glandulifera]